MDENTTLYHNARCGKSRAALQLLNSKGITPEIRYYLQEPLTIKELKKLFKLLKISPEEAIRKTEPVFIENYQDKQLTDEDWIKVIIDNPILLQRPIVVHGKKAIIARPPELLLALFLS